RVPPSPIPEILRTPPTPALYLSPDRGQIALFERQPLPGIAEVAQPELRLAGVRINPRTGGPSRESPFVGLSLLEVESGRRSAVALPDGIRASYARWSPDGKRLAFASTTPAGIELWVVEVA